MERKVVLVLVLESQETCRCVNDCHNMTIVVNSLPNDKNLDWSKLDGFADDKINVTEKLKFVLERIEKHCGKRKKCWLQAFSLFPLMFSKGFLFQGR